MSAHLDRIDQLRERYAELIRGKQEARRFNDELTPELYEAFYHLWRNAYSIPEELSEQNLLLEDGEYRLQPMLALMQELLSGGRVLSTREPWLRRPKTVCGCSSSGWRILSINCRHTTKRSIVSGRRSAPS